MLLYGWLILKGRRQLGALKDSYRIKLIVPITVMTMIQLIQITLTTILIVLINLQIYI